MVGFIALNIVIDCVKKQWKIYSTDICRYILADYNDGIVGKCPKDGYWTTWHNRDHPAGNGDWEIRSLYQPKGTCADGKIPPYAIQARLVSNKLPYQTGGDVLTISPSVGLICKNNDQKDGRCNNYEVRYCCRKCKYCSKAHVLIKGDVFVDISCIMLLLGFYPLINFSLFM